MIEKNAEERHAMDWIVVGNRAEINLDRIVDVAAYAKADGTLQFGAP